jgi:hypothetical protein
MNAYKVMWMENGRYSSSRHASVVVATNEQEARDKVGKYTGVREDRLWVSEIKIDEVVIIA